MNQPQQQTSSRRKSSIPWKTAGLLALLALLLLLLLRSCSDVSSGRGGWGGPGILDSSAIADSAHRADSLARLALLDALRAAGWTGSPALGQNPSLADLRRLLDSLRSARFADSLLRARRLSPQDSLRLLDSLRRADSLARARRNRSRDQATDSATRGSGIPSNLSRLDSMRRATGDSLPPVVFADPAPGVHPAPVDVALIVMEPHGVPLCGSVPESLRTCRNLIRVTSALRLWISGEDSVGNRAQPREMRWHIDPDASRCGSRRALVPMDDGREICVDAYEYPNDPSQFPRTSVNWEDASSLCRKDGKRLCAADELKQSCKGPEDWAYPYGNSYAVSYCQVADGKLIRGIGRPACRSWWGAYHLVGNAWEWTSTPTPNGSSYLTAGGTFEGGPDTRCGRTSRSFFRDNRYEAVGFRCCEDLAK